jgi:hypothetical protein
MDEIGQGDFVFQMENLFRTIYMNQIHVYNKFLKKYPNGSHQNEQIIHSLISDENNDDISILDFLSPVVVIFYVSLQVLCRLQLVRDYSKCFAVYLPFG